LLGAWVGEGVSALGAGAARDRCSEPVAAGSRNTGTETGERRCGTISLPWRPSGE